MPSADGTNPKRLAERSMNQQRAGAMASSAPCFINRSPKIIAKLANSEITNKWPREINNGNDTSEQRADQRQGRGAGGDRLHDQVPKQQRALPKVAAARLGKEKR